MKINSEKLYDFINNLGTDEKVRFKVFYDDNYVTEIYWDGENFRWEPGTFISEAFFNPLYDFIPIEEEKKIPDKLGVCAYVDGEIAYSWSKSEAVLKTKINEIIDYLKSKGE